MGFICAICSVGLDKSPGTNPGDVLPARTPGASTLSTSPCGHVFHTFCIRKWMSGGMANSNMCPCCRKPIPNRTCLPIFPDSYDDSLLDQSQPEADPAIEDLKARYESEINRLKGQLQIQKEETDTQAKLYQLQCEEYHEMKHKFETEQHRSETFMVKFKRYENYKDMYIDMAAECKHLETDIETYKHIQAHLDLSQIEVEQDLKVYSKYSLEEAIRKISGTKNMLQREIASLQRKREEEKNAGQRYLKETNLLKSKLTAANARETELLSVMDNLTDEVKELRSLVKSGTVKKMGEAEVNNNASNSNSSKSQERTKTSRVVRHILDHTVLVEDSDASQDEFDGDVGLISVASLSRKGGSKRPKPVNASDADHARPSTSSSAKHLSKKRARAIDAVSAPGANLNLEDSDVIFCDNSDEDEDNKHREPLSPLEMKIRCNIPGVPPITPHQPLVAKRIGFKNSKTGSLFRNKLNPY